MRINYNLKHLIIILSLILIVLRIASFNENIISWDVFGYYLYLPAKFIYHDLGLVNQEWLNHIMDAYQPSSTLYQAARLENGNWVIQYWMGVSVLLSPFFFIAQVLAGLLNLPADGFSLPYVYSVTAGGILYAIVGLYYLGKVLSQFFDKQLTTLLVLIIFFGTNYLQLTAFGGTLLSHNFLFTFYAILIYYTIRWYQEQKIVHAILIGISLGLIVLIRPSEFVAVFIPLFWNHADDRYWKNKIKLFGRYSRHIVVVAICAFVVLLPQFIYWKQLTGHYIYYSYINAGEGLDLLTPHTLNFLFSFRKGWFIYTPVMVFALAGLYQLYKQNRPVFTAIFIFIVSDIYIISSYTNWWYAGGSFSSRSLVPAYVILAIPFGYFLKKVRSFHYFLRSTIGGLIFLLLFLNLFQTWQFEKGIISKQRMTKEYYFAIFGKTKVSEDDRKLLLVERPVTEDEKFVDREGYVEKILYENDFNEYMDSLNDMSGVYVLDENNIFSPGLDIKYSDITKNDHAWITLYARVFITEKDKEPPLLVATFNYKGKAYKYRAKTLNANQIKYNQWNEITYDYITPEVRTRKDNFMVYLWNRGGGRVLVDKIKVEGYEKTD